MSAYGCKHFGKTISFYQSYIKSCSTNAKGIIFGSDINCISTDNFKNKYKEALSSLSKGVIPDCCKNCFELKENYTPDENIKFETFYISNWLHCNAACIYCAYKQIKTEPVSNRVKKSSAYDILPILQKISNLNLLADSPRVFITGGEPSLLQELPDIIDFFKQHNAHFFQIYSSGIKYNKSIHDLLKSETSTELIVSPDSGTKELYKKIKTVDKFDDFIKNIKHYLEDINPKNKIISKYICIKNVNDNEKDISEWIFAMKNIGIKNIRIDIDYNWKDTLTKNHTDIYRLFNFAEQKAKNEGLNLSITEMAKQNAILSE